MAKVKCPRCFYVNPDGQSFCLQCKTPLPLIKIEAAPVQPAQGPPADAIQFRRGQMVANRYTVLNIIGRGGMGTIYKVHDNTLGEEVALKTLLPQFVQDKLIVERFFNEARIARKLAHPNIVRVHDIGMAGDVLYISMEYVEGKSLRGILEGLPPGQRLPVKQVLHIFDELCAALEYAHQFTVHRDIKPENVMVAGDSTIKLMDFGISKLMANTRLTGASIVMGTPFYMSPEQLRNSRDVDARADIYSVGVMLYEVLTGNMPTGVPKPASEMIKDLPRELDVVVQRCVQPEIKDRYQNAAELRAALLPLRQLILAGGETAQARMTKGPVRTWPMRHVAGWALAGLIAVGVCVGMFVLENRRHALLAAAVAAQQAEGAESLPGFLGLIEHVRTRAEMRAASNDRVQSIFKEAETLWSAARGSLTVANEESLMVAMRALRYYMAALLWREGMVFIPDGEVVVNGAPVSVPGFLIDDSEVTAGQFAAFCHDVPGGWTFPEELGALSAEAAELPVTQVAQYDAAAYAAWLGKLLPTESQWARAAYGYPAAAPSAYPWGTEWKPSAANMGNASNQAVRIKSFTQDRTQSACFDMAGNVSEWTRTPVHEEEGDFSFGTEMVLRGGHFDAPPIPLSEPGVAVYEYRAPTIGFRCVLEIPTAPEAVEDALRKIS